MAELPVERPLRVRVGATVSHVVWGVLIIVLGAGMGALWLFWQAPAIGRIQADKRLWATGTPATDVMVRGNHTRRQFVFHEYKLTVEYTTADGRPRDAELEIDSLTELDTDGDVEVRYDPAHPERIAYNAAVAASGGRWGYVVVIGLLMLGFAVAMIVAGIGRFRRLALFHRVAKSGEELRCQVVSETVLMQKGRETGTELVLRLPGELPWQGREVKLTLGRKRQPRRSGDKHVIALAVADAPDRPVLVESTGYPFVLS